MRKIFFFIILFFSLQLSSQEPPKDAGPKYTGKVSHQYKKKGCSSVVIIQSDPPAESLVLIPKTALPKKLDKEGMIITFNYRRLRMPNPKGCETGMPAELSNIQKK